MWGQISNALIAMWGHLLTHASSYSPLNHTSVDYMTLCQGKVKHTNISHSIIVINKLIFLNSCIQMKWGGG